MLLKFVRPFVAVGGQSGDVAEDLGLVGCADGVECSGDDSFLGRAVYAHVRRTFGSRVLILVECAAIGP